jgi:very-short-patch-repair endonuclease
LAGRQHGVIARQQLLELGFSAKAIEHRMKLGRLHPVMRGIYAVGWPQMTRKRRWMAATLACGPGAALSHRSAAALWGIGTELPGRVDISVRRRCECRRSGIRARSRPSLQVDAIVLQDGIPVTTPAQTLLDLAVELPPLELERAVNDADKFDLIGPAELRESLDAHGGEPGVKALRILLDRHTFRLSDSDLEVLFRPIARAAGLPSPLTKEAVNGFEVDFFSPELGLVVETDGLRYHRTPSAQARDLLRDQTHTAAGLTRLRFSHRQVKYEPAEVGEVLRATARTLHLAASARVRPLPPRSGSKVGSKV